MAHRNLEEAQKDYNNRMKLVEDLTAIASGSLFLQARRIQEQNKLERGSCLT